MKPEIYKNVLPHIHLTSNQIEEMIKIQDLKFYSTKSNIVENELSLPTFARPFYSYIFYHNRIPTQEEYYSYYLARNKAYFDENAFNQNIMHGIKARLLRAMPSFVRDLHFNKYVEERILGFNALYSLELDVEEGIDLLLYNNRDIYGINLYTDTMRARQGRKNKEKRHSSFSNVKYIEFPVVFKESHKCGQYFLYGENEYNNLINILQK